MTMHPLSRDKAEELAIGVLAWMVQSPERIAGFLGQAGLTAQDLRHAAQSPEFLGGVLDYVLSEDAMVLEATEAIGTPPEDILRARAALPGGDNPFWT